MITEKINRNFLKIFFCFFSLTIILIHISCKQNTQRESRSKEDNDFITALTFRHNISVSVSIEKYWSEKEIDKKIITDRVAEKTNYWTPLCFASFIGNRFAVENLINKKANVNYKDANGQTPLILASISGNIEILELLLRHENININEKDINNLTALIHASAEGNIETVKYLVEKGCEMESDQQNALDFAIFYGHKEVITYLKSKGLK